MIFHLTFFTTGHILAVLSYYSVYVNTLLMLLWISFMIWNGSSHYASYLPLKFEDSKSKRQTKINGTPTQPQEAKPENPKIETAANDKSN